MYLNKYVFNRGIIKCYFSLRDEIVLWKEKQIQVVREEVRVKELLVKLVEESKGGQLIKRVINWGEVLVVDIKVILDLIYYLLERIRYFYFLLGIIGIVIINLI